MIGSIAFLYVTLALLFVLVYVALRSVVVLILVSVRARSRLTSVSWPAGSPVSVEARVPYRMRRLNRHLSSLLESVRSRSDVRSFLGISLLLLLAGVWVGLFFFLSLKGILIMALVCGGAPYLWLRTKLLSLQGKARLEFIPAVEVIYQQYLLSEGRNLRNSLHQLLQQERIRYPMRPIFEQLYRNLTTHRGVEESLQLFTLSVGHRWAEYLANMLRVALEEGTDISDNLRELIGDMRKNQLSVRQERNRLLEIRIANFTPILFLAIFVGANIRLDSQMAYTYYVLDPVGRDMLLDALLLIFASFVMGVYLSLKKE